MRRWTRTSILRMVGFGWGTVSSFYSRLRRISQSYFGIVVSCLFRYLRQLTHRLRLAISGRNDSEDPADPETNDTRPPRVGGVEWDPQNQAADGGEHDELDCENFNVEVSDEFYCEYDSTWASEDEAQTQKPRMKSGRSSRPKHSKFVRFEQAARDMQNYRKDYSRFQGRVRGFNQESQDDKPNLEFYLGRRPCLPDNTYIEDIHENWHGKYTLLEHIHTYIQWLFPLEEPGMNSQATPLTKEEIQEFRSNNTARENLLKSYKLMLDFYGIELSNEETGDVQRASNWKDRFINLNSNTHNNLRITRILKCLGTLGYAHYQSPLVQFFLHETLVEMELPRVKESVLNYFVFAVRNKKERRLLVKFAYLNYFPKEEFVWCPKKIQRMWSHVGEDRFSVEENPRQMREKTAEAESATYII